MVKTVTRTARKTAEKDAERKAAAKKAKEKAKRKAAAYERRLKRNKERKAKARAAAFAASPRVLALTQPLQKHLEAARRAAEQAVNQICPKYLEEGAIMLTDGADAYEAFADGPIRCSTPCQRMDCLRRAQAAGKQSCPGWRPRTGRPRFERLYKHLYLAHGVVSHNKAEWARVKEVKVHTAAGRQRSILLKHGTQVADGSWSQVKQAIPNSINSTEHDAIAEYVNAWAFKARRFGDDLFATLCKAAE